MALERNIKTLVHFMAYRGPRHNDSVARGEAPHEYLLQTLKEVLEDEYFGGIEVTHVKDSALRAEVADLLKSSGKLVIFSAQPVQLINEDNLIHEADISCIDNVERAKAVARIKDLVDEAYQFGASALAMVSGRDYGTSDGLGKRNEAKRALARSLNEICNYVQVKAEQLKVEPMKVVLEMFDRLPYEGCKNQLIGPTPDAVEVAELVRHMYGQELFGLLYDLSHMPLLNDLGFEGENPEVLRTLAPYLAHIHIGNCVTDREDPNFGDTHVRLDYPNGANDRQALGWFVQVLAETGYEGAIGFEIAPRGDEVASSVIGVAKAWLDEACARIDVNYALGGYAYRNRAFFPDELFYKLNELRVQQPEAITEAAQQRKKRTKLAGEDGKLLILAADHPARRVTAVGTNAIAMADRQEYLGRIARVVTSPYCDGVMATPDIIEELLLLDYLMREDTGESFLDDKVLVGSMNRSGLLGAEYEMKDLVTAYDAEWLARLNLDGGKILFRLDLESRYSIRTMAQLAPAIKAVQAKGMPVFIEPLPVRRTGSGYQVIREAEELARMVGIAAGMGGTTQLTWLKLPYVEQFEIVAKATTLPILLLGGASQENPLATLENFERGLGVAPNVRGALVGRNVLFPGYDDPRAVSKALYGLVHEGWSSEEAVRKLAAERGKESDKLLAALKG